VSVFCLRRVAGCQKARGRVPGCTDKDTSVTEATFNQEQLRIFNMGILRKKSVDRHSIPSRVFDWHILYFLLITHVLALLFFPN
jgi:hypothetical protein